MTYSGELIEFPAGWPASDALARLLRPAAEGPGFSDRRVSNAQLEELHALMALGPGLAGASPTRLLFVTSPAARARLAPFLAPGTRDAAVLAPVCAVLGYDRAFAEQLLAFLGDAVTGQSCFDRPATLRASALRNGVLQGAYLVLSARALGLEVGFLHGFDGPAVAQEFFRAPGVSAIYVATLGFPRRREPEEPPAARARDGVGAAPAG